MDEYIKREAVIEAIMSERHEISHWAELPEPPKEGICNEKV